MPKQKEDEQDGTLGAAAAPAPAPQVAEKEPAPWLDIAINRGSWEVAWKKHKAAWGQWAALFAGILIQPFFHAYQTTHRWAFDGFWGWTLFALITSVLIFPAVYRNAFDPDKPVIIQMAPIFAAGLGWQSLLATAIKAAGGAS